MGRAFHYLDVLYLALDCYCRAIHSCVCNEVDDETYSNPGHTLELISQMNATDDANVDVDKDEDEVAGKLVRQTAHNLVLCLRSSPGMEHYAREVTKKYLTF